MGPLKFTILGEAASKANARRLVTSRASGKLISIKSAKALAYFHNAALQVPNLPQPFDVPVKVTIHLYYSTERPDLDESVLLDAMQQTRIKTGKNQWRVVRSGVYLNDRLVREKHIIHHIDAENPRAEVTVQAIGLVLQPEDRQRTTLELPIGNKVMRAMLDATPLRKKT